MASSRGLGRGKNTGKPQQQIQRRPKAPQNAQGLTEYLNKLSHDNMSTFGGIFADMVLDYSTNQERMQEAVDVIFDTTTKDKEYGSLGAKICQLIIDTPKGINEDPRKSEAREFFKKCMLQKFQMEYKNRHSLRSQSIEGWLGIFSFLFEFFLRIKVQGQPIKVVSSALMSSISWIIQLDDCDDDEIECICLCVKTVGHLLEAINIEQLKTTIKLLREKVLNRQSSGRARCVIMEVLEYRAFGWKDPNGELDSFYCDALPDAIAEDELNKMNQ